MEYFVELGYKNPFWIVTKAGIPYHDPNLAFEAKDIMDFREYEFRHSELMSSSKYMKMRSMRSEDDEI